MEQSRVVGIKQVKKALREGRALEVILADDADPALTERNILGYFRDTITSLETATS